MGDDESDDYFEEKHSDDDIIAYVDSEEVVTTKEVAEHFDYHLQTARRRLKDIEREGKLNVKDVGKRFVWWIPDRSERSE